MAKAQTFGDKVRASSRTHKKMVRFILPLKKDKASSIHFREGMLAVPEGKEYADYVVERMESLIK